MVSNIDKSGIELIAYYECAGDPDNPKWLKAYLDSGGVPTIGIGTIQYPNGQRVKMGDTITRDQMYEYFNFEMRNKVEKVVLLTRDDIAQSMLNGLVSLTYNIGTSAIQRSTLLKVVNANLTDAQIINRYCDWRFDNGKMIPGLLRRRMSEALHHFTGRLKYNWVNYRTFSAATIAEVKKEIFSSC